MRRLIDSKKNDLLKNQVREDNGSTYTITEI